MTLVHLKIYASKSDKSTFPIRPHLCPGQTHKKPEDLSPRENEERGCGERGVGAGVNAVILSETLKVVVLGEADSRQFRLRKKPMNLCV